MSDYLHIPAFLGGSLASAIILCNGSYQEFTVMMIPVLPVALFFHYLQSSETCDPPFVSRFLKNQPRLNELKAILLNHSGTEFTMRHEPDLEELIEFGEFFIVDELEMKKGEPCNCHENSIKLHESNPDAYDYVTGWALSEDIWRQHSWCMKDKKIFETTAKCDLYFGIIFDD